MDSEQAASAADFLLREAPSAKISSNAPAYAKVTVKEELQFLRINEEAQDRILDTLKHIHGPEFTLKDSSSYEDVKTNLKKQYWVGQGKLVVKGGFNFAAPKCTTAEEESDLMKQFALLRIESYGFHKNHCLEAFQYCNGNIEDTIYLLYHKYYNTSTGKEIDHNLSEKELLEQREDEKSSLESIYEKSCFQEKVKNQVWVLNLKLEYLVSIYHNKEVAAKPKKAATNYSSNSKRKKDKCRNFLAGECKWGDKCRFSHDIPKEEPNPNKHLEEFTFEMEIRFPPNTKYPYEPPMIFLKTNAVLPNLVNLHICKRLHEEARILAEDGIPCVYTITELIKNEEEIRGYLKKEIKFIDKRDKLFPKIEPVVVRPTHYKKGRTNRDNKKTVSLEELKDLDLKIVEGFNQKLRDYSYLKMLSNRKNLPAWSSMKDILNSLQRSQVIVISGETGCGKSTQVPQFILDDWIINYRKDPKHVEIVCTQPRRISAIGVAERVSEERVEKIGNTVGYSIRLESRVSSKTRLSFCTTGILLRRLETEPTLPNVTHIIVDEVHERSDESDFLLLILRDLLPVRPDLKIILMSATVNPALFSEYFGDIPILNIPGRTFPVQEYFLEDIVEVTNYVLEDDSEYGRKMPKDDDFLDTQLAACDVSGSSSIPRTSLKDECLSAAQLVGRYRGCTMRTCKTLFLMNPEKINYELIETILTWIVSGDHNHPKEGTILIFLPGIGEITSLYDQLKDHREFGTRARKYMLLPLHSSLTSEEQGAIFKPPKHGQRKIIIATNIAETSITIDDCIFVIDSGKMKEKHFDPNRNMESLETVWVTRANAQQRKGRAGRVTNGVCFHLYTSHRYRYHMLPEPIPEIHRIPLEQLILKIKILETFEDRDVRKVIGSLIEPPVAENTDSSISRLKDVGALCKDESLTPLGHHLATLPVDVRIGKLMLYGAIFSCLDASLTMAACLSHKSPFVAPFGKKEDASIKKRRFAVGNSDHITTLWAYKKWLSVHKKSSLAGRNFAVENYMSVKTLQTIADIKHQFLEYLVDIGFVSVNLENRRRRLGQDEVLEVTGAEFNRNGEKVSLLSSILCAALYPNVIKVLTPAMSFVMSMCGAVPKENEAKDLKFVTSKEKVFMHPSSVNYKVSNFPSPYLMYQEKVRTSKVYFRDCTMVPVIPLVLFSGFDLDITVTNGETFIQLEDGFILFQVEEHKIAEMMKMIRYELFALLEEKIQDPLLNLLHYDKGEKIISTILYLISL